MDEEINRTKKWDTDVIPHKTLVIIFDTQMLTLSCYAIFWSSNHNRQCDDRNLTHQPNYLCETIGTI